MTAMSPSLDARIERRLQHVNGEIEQHEEHRQNQDGALQ